MFEASVAAPEPSLTPVMESVSLPAPSGGVAAASGDTGSLLGNFQSSGANIDELRRENAAIAAEASGKKEGQSAVDAKAQAKKVLSLARSTKAVEKAKGAKSKKNPTDVLNSTRD